jgi:hypothetical protein
VKQANAKEGFQLLYLVADRAGGYPQFARGQQETALAAGGFEGAYSIERRQSTGHGLAQLSHAGGILACTKCPAARKLAA